MGAEGKTEGMLKGVINLLGRLVCADGETGSIFRRSYAEMAITEAFQKLHMNSQRDTYGNEEEELEKLELSCAVVEFFRECGRKPDLRDSLRSKQINEKFAEILKNEEEK